MKKILAMMLAVMLFLSATASAAVNDSEKEVKDFLQDYFDLRYEMLSTLTYDEGINAYLMKGDPEAGEYITEADVVETIINCRRIQMNDLRFTRYNFELIWQNITISGDTALVLVDESFQLYYNCAPTVKNQAVTEHMISLKKHDGKWYIVKDDYSDVDGIKNSLSEYFLKGDVTIEEAKDAATARSENQSSARLAKLEEIMQAVDDSNVMAFFKGKPVAFASGKAVRIDSNSAVVPVEQDGSILLPLRFIAEKSGAKVAWDDRKLAAVVNGEERCTEIRLGQKKILVDGVEKELDIPARIMNGRTMVSDVVITEVLDYEKLADENGLVIFGRKYLGAKGEELIRRLTEYFQVLYTKADFPRIDGSTATYPLSMEIGKELLGLDEIGVKGFITHNTTHNAYVNLISGAADIIFVTQPSPEELKLAEEKGIELEVVPICKEGFVFLVNEKNPVNNLTSKQLQDIYQGNVKNWKEVGGEDKDIIPYQREANSGSQTIMENTVMKGLKMMAAPREVLVYGMGELIDRVADYSNARNSLGYSVFYYATSMYTSRAVKLISIDGVKPEKQTIKDGSYPFVVGYYAVLKKDEPSDSGTRRLLSWLLAEEGQSIVDRSGFVPLK